MRGAAGVPFVAAILKTTKWMKTFSKVNLKAKDWKDLVSVLKQGVKKCGRRVQFLAHLEGLNAGFSGIHWE